MVPRFLEADNLIFGSVLTQDKLYMKLDAVVILTEKNVSLVCRRKTESFSA